jgi:hypothetical protein
MITSLSKFSYDDGMPGTQTSINFAIRSRFPENAKLQFDVYREIINKFGISCWYYGKHESMGLWQIYTGQRAGIAIKTTYGRLVSQLISSNRDFYVGKVSYEEKFDPFAASSGEITDESIFNSLFLKDVAFKFESEFRILLSLFNDTDQKIGFDINSAVDEIYISPFIKSYDVDMIRSLCETLQLNVPIRLSELLTTREDYLNKISNLHLSDEQINEYNSLFQSKFKS